MRWNCPHCGVALAVADEKLGVGWSFSRCFKCGGFALVRRADVNLVKVDRAPVGEKVVLPEGSEELRMSAQATAHLNQISSNAAKKPTIRPANNIANKSLNATATPVQPPKFTKKLPPLPAPLPEAPAATGRRIMPMAFALVGLIAIGSGFYLYQQGQNLWLKARATAVSNSRMAVRQASAVVPSVTAEDQSPVAHAAAINEVADVVRNSAMAPSREEPTPAPADNRMTIRTTTRASLRSGPGLNYSVLGVSSADARYIVNGWQGQWFHVALPEADQKMAPAGAVKTAWIRNDLVQPVTP